MRSLVDAVKTYVGIHRYFGHKRPRWHAVNPGVRYWLDGVTWLDHAKKPCGCKRLGGGGREYCTTTGHMLADLFPVDVQAEWPDEN